MRVRVRNFDLKFIIQGIRNLDPIKTGVLLVPF